MTKTRTDKENWHSYLVFVGTYTGHGSEGIYSFRFDPFSGEFDMMGLAAATVNPSFLAVDRENRFLYAVNEVDTLSGVRTGGVSAFEVDRRNGKLQFVQQVASHGTAPAHLSIDKTGRYLLVANYNSGSVAVFAIASDGKLGPNPSLRQQVGSSVNQERQSGPHAHFFATDIGNHFALSADLGADRVYIYRFDSRDGSLTSNAPPFVNLNPGAGPRHIAFAPSGQVLYLASEMAGTVTTFAYDQDFGSMFAKQTLSTLVEGFSGDNRVGEILVDGSGRFLYVSNRGDATDEIVVFRIEGDATLSFQERISSGGKEPRHLAIDPTGAWLFASNQNSNKIKLFRIDRESGRLSAGFEVTGITSPTCAVFVPYD